MYLGGGSGAASFFRGERRTSLFIPGPRHNRTVTMGISCFRAAAIAGERDCPPHHRADIR
jgi:hypothetical protein